MSVDAVVAIVDVLQLSASTAPCARGASLPGSCRASNPLPPTMPRFHP